MADPYVGQIIAVGFNFAPVGWLLCDGSTYPISTYEVLYTLLGTTYGGNGQTTFAVPDLRGRGAISAGQGGGLQNYVLGQNAGTEYVTLTPSQIGTHTHTLAAASTATASTPTTATVLGTPANETIYATTGGTTTLAQGSVGMASGGAQPHENRQPFQAVNYIIAAFGLYPPRS